MAVYNHEDTLAEAIESVLAQKTKYDYMLYCFNDASTDSSANILNQYAKAYPDKIKVYTSPFNQGSGKKSFLYHNPSVVGEYWTLLSGDDYWIDRYKINDQVEFLENNSDYVGCSGHTFVKDEVGCSDSVIKPGKSSFNLIDFHLHGNLYTHPSSITWRNVYRDSGSFLPPLYRKKHSVGDVMLMNAMLASGRKMKTLPRVLSCYRITGKGIWSSLPKAKQDELNFNLKKSLVTMLPIKWRLILILQKVRFRLKFLHVIIPGPVNIYKY